MEAIGYFMRAAAIVGAMSLMSPAHAEPAILRIGSPFGPEHASSKAMEIFRAELARGTQNALDVAFFPGGQLPKCVTSAAP